jgi:putative membrane protein
MQRVFHIHGPGGPFGPGGGRIGQMMFNGGGGQEIARLFFMFGFILLLAVLAYFFIRHFDHNQQHQHTHVGSTPQSASADSAASDVLKMRFAKGEIDEDEFTRRMNLLRDHQTTS